MPVGRGGPPSSTMHGLQGRRGSRDRRWDAANIPGRKCRPHALFVFPAAFSDWREVSYERTSQSLMTQAPPLRSSRASVHFPFFFHCPLAGSARFSTKEKTTTRSHYYFLLLQRLPSPAAARRFRNPPPSHSPRRLGVPLAVVRRGGRPLELAPAPRHRTRKRRFRRV